MPISVNDPDYRQRVNQRARERYQARIAAETPEERRARMDRANELRRARRQNIAPIFAQDERRANRISHARAREAEEPAAYEQRLDQQREITARNRSFNLHRAGFSYEPTFSYATLPKLSIGHMDKVCDQCGALKFHDESPTLCCQNGKICFKPPPPPPEPIWSYFSYDFPQAREFMRNIRRYNSCFSMTSFGSTGQHQWPGYMPTFRVQGQIYHRIGSLLPLPDQEPKFLQVYFMGDSALQIDLRTNMFENVRRPLVAEFQQLFDRHNDLIKRFRSALDNLPADHSRICIRADKRPQGTHERTYNAPTSDEVAVVIVDQELSRRDIVLQRRDSTLKRIDESHPFYDALQYPLIFWAGQASWHMNLKQVTNLIECQFTNKRASPMQYYAKLLMVYNNEPNFLLSCGPLLNQFVVDMYAKIEAQRLLFFRTNQKKLRADEYIHLRDAIRDESDLSQVGQQVILPSSFIGGPRHMHEYTQDALCYVRKFGRPDLFITFTCNPSWPEITCHLKPGQPNSDRHDITARVFKRKVVKLVQVLTQGELFGPAQCHMYSIEWQKRGLPHVHLLLWLKERIRPEDLDSVISAELPDPETDPQLFSIIKSQMIHGPCGRINPDCPCMDEAGKCTKRFPRKFVNETQTGEDGYPLYRRRSPANGGYSYKTRISNGQEVDIDNRWVVPHSPVLSRMFNAHINVEYCHSVKSIKYICKYVNKGSDMAVVQLQGQQRVDEVEQYQLGRYISSDEAFWRIFEFDIHGRSPAVVQLAVHLENGQRVYFTEDNALRIVEQPPNTTLTAFFKLNMEDEFARTLLYADVPSFFVWNKTEKIWSRNKRGLFMPAYGVFRDSRLGRLYTVHPSQMECFFLRMLLTRVRGPTCFQDLRTYEGQVYPTYRDACQARGLLEDDKHWESAIEEAVTSRMPTHLRSLFAMIISCCYPSNPVGLWEKFQQPLSEDLLHDLRRQNPTIEVNYNPGIFNQALILIENLTMNMCGKALIQLGMPSPERSTEDCMNSEVLREFSYNRTSMERVLSGGLPNLVPDQRVAYEAIISAIRAEEGGLYFLDAPGGTGKTFLLNLILARIRLDTKIILACASSGIAATLLAGGRTAHSALKIPIDIDRSEEPVCSVKRGTSKGKLFQQCKAIIWDECTMSHKKSLEALDRTMRDIRGIDQIFGGVVVILAGDFRQTLPVIPRSTPADELNACLKQSFLWRHVKTFTLKTNMRVHLHGDAEAGAFAAKLLTVGDGTHPTTQGRIKLTTELCQKVQVRDELIERVFPDIQRNIHDENWLQERAILAPRNDSVDELNAQIQDKLLHESRTYYSVDQTMDLEQAVHYPIEFLNAQNPTGVPPHKLHLKIGSPVMVLRNINPPLLCNGTRLCVKKFHRNMIEGTILAGPYKGETVFIPRIPFTPKDCIVEFKRLQFPLKLAYGFTINKSQGQSLKVVGAELTTSCFSHGQLYVACSRVGSASNLYVQAPGGETKNVVYQQALQ